MDESVFSHTAPTSRGLVQGERVFRRFVLVRQVGRGGMGVVWLARDEILDAEVALKFLADALRWDVTALAALRQETRRSRELTHSHIVRVHDIHEDAGAAAIAMEFLSGGSLHQRRTQRTPPLFGHAEIAQWLPGLCAALDYAHGHGVVHRDLKPSNLLLSVDDAIKVTDFGIAQPLFESALRISQWAPSGTLAYMSPQQQFGEPPGKADDVYALGATLYDLLTGKPPFYTGNLTAQIERRRPDSIAVRRRQLGAPDVAVPPAWEKTIAACLAKRPEDRPASAGEVAGRLTGTTSMPARLLAAHHAASRLGRLRVVRPAVLGALAFALGVTAWVFRPGTVRPAPGRTEPVFASDATRAIGAWNFDGDGRDASGHGLRVNLSDAVPVTDRYGRIDRALHLNGTTVVESEESPLLAWDGAQPFTVGLWVRPQGLADATLVYCGASETVGTYFWSLGLTQGRLLFTQGGQHVSTPSHVTAPGQLRTAQWSLVAAIFDGQSMCIAVNGREVLRVAQPKRPEPAPSKAVLRVGLADRLDPIRFVGDVDELRIWRRALGQAEILALANPLRPPRFLITAGIYSDKEDLSTEAVREYGPGATLADWTDLQKWHRDDTQAFANEIGLTNGQLTLSVQCAGQRFSKAPRQYFINRFDGMKPDYYLAHDELGGMTLALGSWYGFKLHALVMRPGVAPQTLRLVRGEAAEIRQAMDTDRLIAALAVGWHQDIVRNRPSAVRLQLRQDNGTVLEAVFNTADTDTFALALGTQGAPQVSRRVPASYDRLDFIVTAKPGRLEMRAVSEVGGSPLFQESADLPGFHPADVKEVSLTGVDSAELTVEK